MGGKRDGQMLTGIGRENIMAVAMGDAVLLGDRSQAQDVKAMVKALRKSGVDQAASTVRESRPRGWFETIAKGKTFHVKILNVDSGGRLSRQSYR